MSKFLKKLPPDYAEFFEKGWLHNYTIEYHEEMETKFKKNIEYLTTKLNIELAKMRKTFDALERKMKTLQRDLEVLYVNSQTGEITPEKYEKYKREKSKEIEKMKKVSKTVANILAEAR